MTVRSVIDSDRLDVQEARELADLLESSNFFDADVGSSNAPAGGADRFHYSLTIEMGMQSRTVEVSEANIPDQWQRLIQRIDLLARRFRA